MLGSKRTSLSRAFQRIAVFAVLTLAGLAEAAAQAPDYGSSPYSDQKYDGANHLAWYEEPFLWAGFLLFAVAIGLYILRRRRKYS